MMALRNAAATIAAALLLCGCDLRAAKDRTNILVADDVTQFNAEVASARACPVDAQPAPTWQSAARPPGHAALVWRALAPEMAPRTARRGMAGQAW